MSILGVQPICCCRHSSAIFEMLLGDIVGFCSNRLVRLGFGFNYYNIDFIWLFLLSLLLRVLVSIVSEVAVITILGYCPLMS